jgi:hypothetical protein
MKKRPLSVTVISWILIVIGALSIATEMAMRDNPMVRDMMARTPMPVSVQYALQYLGLALTVVSGIFMLRGKAWARLLYVAWGAVGLLIGLATSPVKMAMIPGTVIFAIIVFFLFRRSAGEYFSPSAPQNGSPDI